MGRHERLVKLTAEVPSSTCHSTVTLTGAADRSTAAVAATRWSRPNQAAPDVDWRAWVVEWEDPIFARTGTARSTQSLAYERAPTQCHVPLAGRLSRPSSALTSLDFHQQMPNLCAATPAVLHGAARMYAPMEPRCCQQQRQRQRVSLAPSHAARHRAALVAVRMYMVDANCVLRVQQQ